MIQGINHQFNRESNIFSTELKEKNKEFIVCYFSWCGAVSGIDPRRALAEQLVQDIPLHVKNLEEQMKVREQLLKYCELDTLAMVKVLGKLKEVMRDR